MYRSYGMYTMHVCINKCIKYSQSIDTYCHCLIKQTPFGKKVHRKQKNMRQASLAVNSAWSYRTKLPGERHAFLESLLGWSRFAEKLASPMTLAASKGVGAGNAPTPAVHKGPPKPAARESRGDVPGQPSGKRLCVETSAASLQACMAMGEQ